MGDRIRLLVGALCLAWGGPAAAAAAPSIGVAPFERVGARGQEVPDVASALADRLATRGVEKVVGPASLGAEALAEPAPQAVSGWAGSAGVTYVVVGRTTRLGNALSVDVQVLDGASGRPMGARIIEESSRVDDLGRTVDGLAGQVLERVGQGGAPSVAAVGPAGAAAPAKPKRQGAFSKDSPISIKSDELEAVESGGQRKFVFTGRVRAIQQDLVVNSDRLEAFYPPGASQPERMVATGHVVLEQTGRTAHCQKAIYFREDQRIECTGNAQLDQACDRVRGEKITFFLGTEVLKVTGAADVKLRPDDPSCAAPVAAAGEAR